MRGPIRPNVALQKGLNCQLLGLDSMGRECYI